MTADPRIAPAFAAAQHYDAHARIQQQVARRLAARIAALPLPAAPRVLEIGCGTGFLTEALLAQCGDGSWLITDLTPAMVDRCRAKLGDRAGVTFRPLDGELGPRPAEAPFDLICASLAFQWFADLPAALPRLLSWLAPGGHLLFTTLGAGTFAEWHAAHIAEGLTAGIQAFPAAASFATLLTPLQASPPTIEWESDTPATATEFLRGLRAIGAGTPRQGHKPLGPLAMRRVMARFEQGPARATYEILTCHYRRPE